jgi:hypothetical protein
MPKKYRMSVLGKSMYKQQMITKYVKDVNRWLNWQQEYRYGVIVILPPDPPLSEVNKLRAKHDPRGYAIIGAHISLTVQLSKGVDKADWRELKSIAAGVEPLTIRYGPVFNVLPTAPGVILAIEPKAELAKIIASVETAAVFKFAPSRPFPFLPHMTIAEYVDAEQTKILTAQLKDIVPQGSFRCTYLSYIVPDESFHFTA